MNDFKQRLRVKKKEQDKSFREKVSLAITKTIENIETSSKGEEIQKIEYMINLNKIMDNYEEIRPVLTEYFREENLLDR